MKKPSIMKKLLSFLLKVVVVVLIMCCFGFGSFEGVTYYLTGSLYDFKKVADEISSTESAAEQTVPVDNEKNEDLENHLLFVDSEDGLTEYILLQMLNKKTKALDIVLFPANAQVQVSRDMSKELQKKLPGKSSTVEFRDIERVYGEDQYDMLGKIVEEMTGLKIHGWDHMTSAQAVDFLKIAGDITMKMKDAISYRDNKGILHVMEQGENSFSGEEAMVYLNYLNGTANQESDRLSRTEAYLRNFFDRLITQKKSSTIMEAYQKNAESSEDRNFENLTEAFKTSDPEFLTIRILQGSESGDVFTIDNQKAQLQISTQIKQAASFNQPKAEVEEEEDDSYDATYEEGSGDSKNLSIEIYNAAYVSGIASEWEYFLEEEGYNISLVDTYQQEGPIATTRIILKKEGIGEDLKKYFPDAEYSVGNIETGNDIQIYVGTDHISVGPAE